MAKIYSVKSGNVVDESPRKKREVVYRGLSSSNPTVVVEISFKTILLFLFLLAFVFLGKQLLSIGLFLFLGFVFMSAIRPVVLWLQRMKVSKGLAVFLSYLTLFVILVSVSSLIFVPFVNQLAGLVAVLPEWFDDVVNYFQNIKIGNYQFNFDLLSPYIYDLLKSLPTMDNVKNIADFLSGFVGIFGLLLTSIIFSIYLVLEHDAFFDILFIRIVSDQKRERVKKLVSDVERKLGSWVLGQATVSSLVTVFAGIVLSILGVSYAIPLAIFIGLACLIPQFGATFGALIVGVIALLTVGPVKALIFLILFFIYQQLENTLIVPKVMGNAVGLKPILVMLGVIIFLIFLGPVGSLVAVPLIVILKILYEFYIDLQKLKAKGIV